MGKEEEDKRQKKEEEEGKKKKREKEENRPSWHLERKETSDSCSMFSLVSCTSFPGLKTGALHNSSFSYLESIQQAEVSSEYPQAWIIMVLQ